MFFGEGDSEPRTLNLAVTFDQVAEPDKTLNLSSSEPRGCAALGAQSTATVTILDDDRPERAPLPSRLDETFGSAGKATLAGFGGGDSAKALQARGKIVMVGGRFTDLALARFNTDGSLDSGAGGKTRTARSMRASARAQGRARRSTAR